MTQFRELVKELEQLHEEEVCSLKEDIRRLERLLSRENENVEPANTIPMDFDSVDSLQTQSSPRETMENRVSAQSSVHSAAGTVLQRVFNGLNSSAANHQNENEDMKSTRSTIALTLDFVNRSGPGDALRRNRYRERVMTLGFPSPLENFLIWFMTLEEPSRHGFLFRVTSSNWFQAFCMWVIFLNALVIIYSTERDIQDAFRGSDTTTLLGQPLNRNDWNFIFEMFFTCVAILEISMKLMVHRLYFFVNDEWKMNLLDISVVVFSVLPYTIGKGANLMHVRMSKAARSARLLRLLRSFKYFRQLNLLVQCTVGALSSAFWCLVFLFVVVLAFAVVFMQALVSHVEAFPEDIEEAVGRFKGTLFTMLRLFQIISGGEDWALLYHDLSMIGSSCQALLILYIAFCVVVMWNLISAIFIERALAFSLPDMEAALAQRRLTDEQDIADLTALFRSTKGLDSKTSKRKFVERMQSPEVQEFFSVRDISVTNADLFFTMLHASIPGEYASEESHEGRELRIDTRLLVAACLHMRGAASNYDLQALHWDIRRMHAEMHESLSCSGSTVKSVLKVAAEIRQMHAEIRKASVYSGSSPRDVVTAAAAESLRPSESCEPSTTMAPHGKLSF